jgi:cation diffusion facilitator CzcD-associated flavoprotein CzcO
MTTIDTPTTTNGTLGDASREPRHHDVVVIGAGFAGVGAAIKLREAGFDDFVVLEKSDNVGGTWRDNTYPGCACDVPSSLYSFSFAPNPDWSRVYAEQPEIQDYLERVSAEQGVTRRVQFDTEVIESRWVEADGLWHVDTTQGPYTARVVISGTGPLHEPRLPDWPGIETFEGTIFHTARWNHDHDLGGERVAVVGTGSSAIQLVPKIQPEVGRLTLFQRTAPWVLPKLDFKVPKFEKALFRRAPRVQRFWRNTLYGFFEGVQFLQRHPKAMRQVQKIGMRHLKQQVKNPELRRVLTPNFTLGCKRILMSNTYYEALQQPNAEVVPHAVREVRAHSIVDSEGVEREVDTIILGTGFHVSDTPIAERVRGRAGQSLAEHWQGSPQAYLGTTVSGFPNYFGIIGPNIGNGHSSAIVLIEAQLKYIVDALRTMRARGAHAVDVRPDVQAVYNDKVQEALAGTVWNAGGCQSYYLDRNGRNSAIYPWTTIDLRRRTATFDIDSYDVTRRAVPAAAA